jgi:hypothetical protein
MCIHVCVYLCEQPKTRREMQCKETGKIDGLAELWRFGGGVTWCHVQKETSERKATAVAIAERLPMTITLCEHIET